MHPHCTRKSHIPTWVLGGRCDKTDPWCRLFPVPWPFNWRQRMQTFQRVEWMLLRRSVITQQWIVGRTLYTANLRIWWNITWISKHTRSPLQDSGSEAWCWTSYWDVASILTVSNQLKLHLKTWRSKASYKRVSHHGRPHYTWFKSQMEIGDHAEITAAWMTLLHLTSTQFLIYLILLQTFMAAPSSASLTLSEATTKFQ